jgi:predicted MFS family arabinose efflux permease
MHGPNLADKTASDTTPPSVTRAAANYTLTILCVIAVVNYIDRQVLSILLEEVKHDLGASDTQMGLLNGFVFASVYIIAGIPLSRLVDRGSRRNVLVACMVAWSAATILCGLTRNYWQLALARMGVAAGEAGASPSSQSLIADLFPRTSRGRALGLWSASNSMGIGLGLLLGGFLSHYLSWRGVFVVVGLPGLALAILTLLTVREPARSSGDEPTPSLRDTVRHLASIPSYRMAILVIALAGFCGSGIFGWLPTFLIRIHGMSVAAVGAWSGLASIGSLVISHILAGWLADRYGRSDPRAYFIIPAVSVLLTAPIVIAFCFVTSQTAVIALFFASKLALGLHMVPMYTVVLSLAPSNMRGLAGFTLAIALNLAGAGLGPFFVGAMNDVLAPRLGTDAIRYSIALLTVTLFIAFVVTLWATRGARADFERHATT